MAGTIAGTSTIHRARGVTRCKVTLQTTVGETTMTATKVGPLYGRLIGVGYKPNTLATGADIIVKDEQTGATILTLTNAGTANRFFRPSDLKVDAADGSVLVSHADRPHSQDDIWIGGTLTVEAADVAHNTVGYLYLIVQEGPEFGENLQGGGLKDNFHVA